MFGVSIIRVIYDHDMWQLEKLILEARIKTLKSIALDQELSNELKNVAQSETWAEKNNCKPRTVI